MHPSEPLVGRVIRRLAVVATLAVTAALLLAAPALAAGKGDTEKFNPIVPMLVMLGIGALIFGVAYALDKRKD